MAAGTIYSFSRITAFKECPRKYEYSYIDRVPPEFTSIELFVGSVAHEALSWLYAQHKQGSTPDASALVDAFDVEWKRGLNNSIKVIKSSDSLAAQKDRAIQMLQSHYRDVFKYDRLDTISLEEQFTLDLNRQYGYTGIIDRLARDQNGRLHIIDFKTTKRPPSYLDDDSALQLRAYALGILAYKQVKEVQLTFQFLQNSSSLSEQFLITQSKEIIRRVVGRIAEIENATNFPANPSNLCAWCGFNGRCESSGMSGFKGGSSDTISINCPKCGAMLRQRSGRNGAFMSCENFPKCRYSRNIAPNENCRSNKNEDDNICPRCGGELELKEGSRGPFMGCENFPECRYCRDA